MNEQIINNLYELWTQIGLISDSLIEDEEYRAVLMRNSDWPNRIFGVSYGYGSIEEIKTLSQKNVLPKMITIPKPNGLNNDSDLEFVFGQKNMALDLDLFSTKLCSNPKIKRVKTKTESTKFAETASKSFGYLVDQNVIFEIVRKLKTVRVFIYQEGSECLGCGIIFFDSSNNAGLHMIGTLPKGRGKGIGKSMTEHLLMEAKKNNSKIVALNASKLGEPIYMKLGFKAYGEIETYKILKNKNS